MYALKYKNTFDFLCVAETEARFQEKIYSAFWKWKGIQSKGSTATIDDFLSEFEKVIVTVEPYNG